MEGGTDFDLGALDEPFVQSEKEDGPRSRNNSESMPQEKRYLIFHIMQRILMPSINLGLFTSPYYEPI